MKSIAIAAIKFYQKKISPHKGYSCAHRVYHGGDSCSQYVKNQIVSRGTWRGIGSLWNRSFECKAAAKILRLQRIQNDKDKKRQRDKRDSGNPEGIDNSDNGGFCCFLGAIGDLLGAIGGFICCDGGS